MSSQFEVEWQRTPSARVWPDDLKRSVIRDLYRAGVRRERVVAHLDAIDARFPASEEVYTRVAHCKEQTDAYLEVGEQGRARQSLERLMRTSSGVGTRKDYQLSHWIDWLDRVFDLEPSEAAGRVIWFGRAVVSLRDSTDRAHYRAAARLLEVVARRSPGWAIRLLLWFHEHSVLIHEEGVEILLREALTADRSLAVELQPVLANCYLPISSDAARQVLCSLFAELALVGNHRVLGAARGLAEAAKSYAIVSSRQDWLRTLAELLRDRGLDPAAVGVDVAHSTTGDEQSREESWNTLLLGDSTKLSRDEVIARVNSAAELLHLMSQEATAKDGERVRDFNRFDWVPVIVSIADRLGTSDVIKAAEVARSFGRNSPKALTALARRASALGQVALAFQLGEGALRSGDPVGWGTHIDGGTRLTAAQTLVSLDPLRGRGLAWRTLEGDLSGGVPPWGWIAYDLPELVDVLSEHPPVQDLYREVEEHVRGVFSGAEFPSTSPPDITENTRSESWQVALGRLIEFQLTFPANRIAHGSQRCLVHLLLEESELARDLVARLLAADIASQEVVLEALDSVSLVRAEAVGPFEEAIRSLGSSPHLGIRRMASDVLRRMGLPQSPRPVIQRPLPAVYGLALAERSEDAEGGTASTPSTAESEALAVVEHCWAPLLRCIADSRGIAYANLVARLFQILDDIHPAEGRAGDADERRGRWMSKMGLRMVFRRPRYLAVRAALSYLLGELLDAGRLTPQMIGQLWPFLRYWDPTFLTVGPVPRPDYVGAIAHEPANPRKWSEAVDTATLLPTELPDGWLLLAEQSNLSIPAWERLREERVSQLAIEDYELDEESTFFATVTNATTLSYPEEDPKLHPLPLVIRNIPRGQDSPASEWIALNPAVAGALGWKPAGSGLFRWVNAVGTLMAETRWWVDGPVETSPPENDLVGEGFMVVVSQEALDSIKARYGRLVRLGRVTRTSKDEDQTISVDRSTTMTA